MLRVRAPDYVSRSVEKQPLRSVNGLSVCARLVHSDSHQFLDSAHFVHDDVGRVKARVSVRIDFPAVESLQLVTNELGRLHEVGVRALVEVGPPVQHEAADSIGEAVELPGSFATQGSEPDPSPTRLILAEPKALVSRRKRRPEVRWRRRQPGLAQVPEKFVYVERLAGIAVGTAVIEFRHEKRPPSLGGRSVGFPIPSIAHIQLPNPVGRASFVAHPWHSASIALIWGTDSDGMTFLGDFGWRMGPVDKDLFLDRYSWIIDRDWTQLEHYTAFARTAAANDAIWENFEYLVILSRNWMRVHPSTYPKGVPRLQLHNPWPVPPMPATA